MNHWFSPVPSVPRTCLARLFIEKVGSDALIFLFDTLAPLGEHRLELLFWNCCVLARPISEVLVDALLRESWSFGSTSDPILFAVLIVSGRTSPSAAPPSSARTLCLNPPAR